MMRNIFCIIIILFSGNLFAQKINLVERVVETESKEKNAVAARQILISQATAKVSEDLIKEIIGEAKYARNKALINSKVIQNSARYVPFTKPGDLRPDGEGFKMTVTLKVNADDLQALLLEHGLLYESDSTPALLPMVRFFDKVNMKSFVWWTEQESSEKAFLIKESKLLETKLREAFQKVNFYSLNPVKLKYYEMLPAAFHSENLRPEDQQLLSKTFSAPILLDGQVLFTKSPNRSEAQMIEIRLVASQISNGRVIAEVSRQFETDMGPFETVIDRKMREVLDGASQDLANQVLDAWQRGAIGSSLYKLMVRGRIPMTQQEAFKVLLKNKVREVKNVRERLISSDSLVYEVDASIGPKELAQKAPKFDLQGYTLVLESASDSGATYKATRQ